MVLKILAVTPGSESACPPQQETVRDPKYHWDWQLTRDHILGLRSNPVWRLGRPLDTCRRSSRRGGTWDFPLAPGTIKWDDLHCRKAQRCPVYLLRLKSQYRHLNLNLNLVCNPTNPGERQKDVYGIQKASKDARTLWLCHAAHKVRSEEHPEVQPAYEHFVRLNGLHEAFSRAVIVYDISWSLLPEIIPDPLANMLLRHLLLTF